MYLKRDLYYSPTACAMITGSVDTLRYLPHFLLLQGHSDTQILFSDLKNLNIWWRNGQRHPKHKVVSCVCQDSDNIQPFSVKTKQLYLLPSWLLIIDDDRPWARPDLVRSTLLMGEVELRRIYINFEQVSRYFNDFMKAEGAHPVRKLHIKCVNYSTRMNTSARACSPKWSEKKRSLW